MRSPALSAARALRRQANDSHAQTGFCLSLFVMAVIGLVAIATAQAQQPSGCKALPDHDALRTALQAAEKGGTQANGGLGNQEWGVIVDRNGIVCAIAYSGDNASQEWPGSRMIAADKANTANGFSGPDFALSTANVYWPSQPGQSLYGIITSQPPNPQAAFGDPATFGTANDPMVGKAIGGVIVFGGGLALYSGERKDRRRPRPERRYVVCRSRQSVEGAASARTGCCAIRCLTQAMTTT